VRDLAVRGANPRGGASAAAYVPALEGQAGIAVVGSRDVVLDDVTVSDTYGDLVYVAGGAQGVTVTRSRLRRSGRQGVAVVNGSAVTIRDSELSGVGRSVLDLEPPGRGLARDVHFVGNRVGEYRNFLLAAIGGGPGVEAVEVRGNEITARRGLSVAAGIDRVTRRDLRVVDNRGTAAAEPLADYGTGALLQVTNIDGVVVRGNTQPVRGGVAITLDRVCRSSVGDNAFPGADAAVRTLGACGTAAPPPTRAEAPAPPTAAPPTAAPPAATAPARTAPPPADDGTDWPAFAGAALGGLVVGGIGGWWLARRRRRAAQPKPDARNHST
jgi:hypothetical protein